MVCCGGGVLVKASCIDAATRAHSTLEDEHTEAEVEKLARGREPCQPCAKDKDGCGHDALRRCDVRGRRDGERVGIGDKVVVGGRTREQCSLVSAPGRKDVVEDADGWGPRAGAASLGVACNWVI
jgi:hypothetical protein